MGRIRRRIYRHGWRTREAGRQRRRRRWWRAAIALAVFGGVIALTFALA